MLEFLELRHCPALRRLLTQILSEQVAIIEGENYGRENGTSGCNRYGRRQPIGL
jgi:hypothetical protein